MFLGGRRGLNRSISNNASASLCIIHGQPISFLSNSRTTFLKFVEVGQGSMSVLLLLTLHGIVKNLEKDAFISFPPSSKRSGSCR